ncbi:hypothetical protein CDD83_2300 [Cordyceps sp. RAO-2017]|nr:hypothetical protein CDD83_2300 [Cordyceps sp. RAO-2017]
MFGFEHNDVDPNDTIPIQALKVCLRRDLPRLAPVMRQRVQESVEAFLSRSGRPWTVPVFSLTKAVCGRVSNQILFGSELGESLTWQHSFLGWALMSWSGASWAEAICSPGRWYASDLIKYALIHLLQNYNIKPAQQRQPRPIFWTTAIAPSLSLQVVLERRNGASGEDSPGRAEAV